MKRLKIGVIGIGHMGQYHVNVVSSLTSKFILSGVYDTNLEKAKEISEKFGTKYYDDIERLFNVSDSVIIAVPTYLHYKYASMALERNLHVLVEKPVTENVAQAKELASKAKRRGLLFQVGHVERFNGAVQELYKIVTNPLLIESRRMTPFSDRIKDVGVVLDLMIHDIDIIMNIVNHPLVSVKASGGSLFTEYEDYAHAVLHFRNGCVATVTASRVTQRKTRTLAVSQEKSYIFLDYATQDIHIHRQASQAFLLTKEEIKYSQEAFVEELFVHKENPLKQELEHFYNCIKNGSCPIISNDADSSILETALEIERQIRNQRNIDRLKVVN